MQNWVAYHCNFRHLERPESQYPNNCWLTEGEDWVWLRMKGRRGRVEGRVEGSVKRLEFRENVFQLTGRSAVASYGIISQTFCNHFTSGELFLSSIDFWFSSKTCCSRFVLKRRILFTKWKKLSDRPISLQKRAPGLQVRDFSKSYKVLQGWIQDFS